MLLFEKPNLFSVFAGPCAVESYGQLRSIAQKLLKFPVAGIRGGVFKIRSRFESFQGLGLDAIPIIQSIKEETKLPLVTEITSIEQIPLLSQVVDVFQVGTRNMHNTELLKALGQQPLPILLKRGFSAYIEEWLQAAEYIRSRGNSRIILCERGIRTFETKFRNTLDLTAVAWLKKNCSFPVIVDPSHGTGQADLVADLSLAAAATGADGLLVEVHPDPRQALSDGPQTLDFFQFENLMTRLAPVLHALGKSWNSPHLNETKNSLNLC